jgi:hypothetical protein
MKFLSQLFIAILIAVIFTSCDIEEDRVFRTSQVSPILNASVPDTMILEDSYTLGITYQKDSDCHTFSNLESVNQGDSLVFVRAITTFTQSANCYQGAEGVLEEIDFTNEIASDFTFKFLQDVNSEGESLYIDKEVVVLPE